MKRHSAGKNTDVRKRTDSEVSRHFGPLTEIEIEEIRQAYLDGCKGDIIIGLRGDKRIITMLVPAQLNSASFNDGLLGLGCDGFIRVRGMLIADAHGR